MVELDVNGDCEECTFRYICTTTSDIASVLIDIATIYSARRAWILFRSRNGIPSVSDDNNAEQLSEIAATDKLHPQESSNLLTIATSWFKTLSECSAKDACTNCACAITAFEKSSAALARSDRNCDSDSLLRDRRATNEENTFTQIYGECTLKDPCLYSCGKLLCATKEKKLLNDFVSITERSKLRVYVRSAKDGRPPQTHPIDRNTYVNMVAYYHNREAELEELRKSDEESRDRDHFLSAPWANPRALKESLIGNSGQINYSF
jgi:hypothetical protein